jgi:hypothetical protein
MGAPTILPQIYSKKDLEVFNILKNPVWVFDVTMTKMWWANTPALVMWSAETLDELIDRNFISDMSEATTIQLKDYLLRFQEGEQINDQVCM